jgi:DNA-binding transcriptional ArsR family regulator
MEPNNLEQRLQDLEKRLAAIEERGRGGRRGRPGAGEGNGEHRHRGGDGRPGWSPEGRDGHGGHRGEHGRGWHRGRGNIEMLRHRVGELGVAGLMGFRGYHRTGTGEDATEYVWATPGISTDDVLAMDDDRNVKVLAALAHPVRLRMMKAILQQPGTAAELRERLGLTSTGQTYHALNLLQNGGMVTQQADGTYTAVNDKASGFLVLLGGLYNLTERDYAPAFADIDLDDEEEWDDADASAGQGQADE